MPRLNDYLTIKEAAAYLGVSQNTLRNWGRDGKIKEIRHPVNHYRLYSLDSLTALLQSVSEQDDSAYTTRKPK